MYGTVPVRGNYRTAVGKLGVAPSSQQATLVIGSCSEAALNRVVQPGIGPAGCGLRHLLIQVSAVPWTLQLTTPLRSGQLRSWGQLLNGIMRCWELMW
jgi:hypothetical protein